MLDYNAVFLTYTTGGEVGLNGDIYEDHPATTLKDLISGRYLGTQTRVSWTIR